MLIKLKELRIKDLNVILSENGIQVAGSKQAKIAELEKVLGNDEIDTDDYDLNKSEESGSMGKQFEELKKLVVNLTQVVHTMTMQQQAQVTQRQESLAAAAVTTVQTEEIISPVSSANTMADTVQGNSVVKDVVGVLPEFDPIKGCITSEQFITKIEQLQQVYCWKDEIILFAAQHKLKGVAKEWLDVQPVFETWQQFVRALTQDFPSLINSADTHREMMRRKRKYNETLTEYFYSMLAMGRRANMDEPSINSYIINGLNQPESTRALLAINVRSCSELLQSIQNMKSAQSVPQYFNFPTAKSTDMNHNNEISKGPKCYNCNQMGHIAIKCTAPQRRLRCTKCLKIGHEEKNCKTKGSSVAQVYEEKANSYPPIMKKIKIGSIELLAFVDTGSDNTLIKESFVPKDVSKQRSVKRLQGFGGAVVESQECILTKVEYEGQQLFTTIQVVPDKFLMYPILLGRDIISRNNNLIKGESEIQVGVSVNQQHFDISADINGTQRNQVSAVLKYFEGCFAEDLSNIGRCKMAEMKIEASYTKPILGKRYQVPFSQRGTLRSILDDLLKNNIIQRSTSPHAASVLLVPKANGENRLCIDYRALNAVTVKKQYPMPIVEEQLAKLAGNKYFTTLDMTSGYYQIPMSHDSKKFTAFMTPDGLFEYNVMPFGLVNAPMVFQEVISNIIRGLENQHKIISYVDEVIIASTSVDEGLTILKEFLNAIASAGLTLRPSKCSFMQTKVKFLGHVINNTGIQPGTEKTRCIDEYPKPRNETEIRRFLGITGFFRKFVKQYSLIAQPLSKLLKKNEQFIWKEEQNNAFKRLKAAITSQPVLTLYDPTKYHEVHTDASATGIAAVLFQREEEGLKPAFYYSRLCSDAESRYSSHELEVLAITEALERFRIYLLGAKFLVVTDCNAVATLKASTALIPRVARWWLKLQEFDFECIHRAGELIPHVDGMSRQAVLQTPDKQLTVADNVLKVTAIDEDWVYTMQKQDPKIKEIFEILQSKNDSIRWPQVKEDYVNLNSRLYRKTENGNKLVIPQAVRWRILKSNHDDAGHYGTEKTLERVRRYFWFPRMRNYVKSYIASCPDCCINKVKGGKPIGEMHVGDVIPIPFRTINIDHVGPFPKSTAGNCHILVIACAFSKYTFLTPVRNTKTTPVIKALKQMFSVFGQPLRIISDRGTSFTSKEFEKFVKLHGIQHVKTAVRTPRANGQVERINKTLLSALKCSTNKDKEWDQQLLNIQWSINTNANSTTKFTPNDLVFNFNPRDVSYNRIVQALVDDSERKNDVITNQQQAAINIEVEKQKWKQRYDAKHTKPHQFKVDDLVVINFVPTASGETHKLDPAFKGPYVVSKVLGNDRYVIEDLPDQSITQRRYSNVVSSDHMKPWCALIPTLDVDENSYNCTTDDDELSGKAELSKIN